MTPPAERYADESAFGFFIERPNAAAPAADDYVELVMAPRSIVFDEPYATAVTFTQGGGKFVERRGQLVKNCTISGTTGFLPPSRRHASATSASYVGGLVDFGSVAEAARATRSGFKAFHDLRALFRKFGAECRKGEQNLFHYFDTKEDEFWQIEPTGFTMRRSSPRNAFTYDYEIRFTCIEPSGASLRRPAHSVVSLAAQGLPRLSALADIADGRVPRVLAGRGPARAAIRRLREMVDNGKTVISLVEGAAGSVLLEVTRTVSEFVMLRDELRDGSIQTATLLSRIESSIEDAFQEMSAHFEPEDLSEGVLAEWNEWLLEARLLCDHMAASDADGSEGRTARIDEDVRAFSVGRPSAFADETMPETGRPLTSNPFVGDVGLDGVSDPVALASRAHRSVVVFRGDTIYDVAKRAYGSVHRWVDLVFANDLTFPFVVAEKEQKTPGTVAWGEHLKVPVAVESGVELVAAAEAPLPSFSGAVTATGSSTEVVDASIQVRWRPGQWVGYYVILTSGDGVEDGRRIIVDNDETTLVVSRAWTMSPDVGDTFDIVQDEFHLRSPATPEQVAFGTDFLLKFYRQKGDVVTSPNKASWLLDARGDIAQVTGLENYVQALHIRCATPVGAHPCHPKLGIQAPVGLPAEAEEIAAYAFLARQSLLEDPRTDDVRRPRMLFSGGKLSFEADVKPINVHRTVQVSVSR